MSGNSWTMVWTAGLAVLAVAAIGACAHTEVATLSMVDIDCQSCGFATARALERKDGVEEATFDRKAVEVRVRYEPERVRPEELAEAVRALGHGVELGAGRGRWLRAEGWPEGADLQTVNREGEDVDLGPHVVPGKVTVFDFYAEWCGPCRKVDEALREWAASGAPIAVRKVNVVDWDTPVAKRYLAGVPELPYVLVYGAGGERLAAVSGLDLETLLDAIERGGAVAAGGAP